MPRLQGMDSINRGAGSLSTGTGLHIAMGVNLFPSSPVGTRNKLRHIHKGGKPMNLPFFRFTFFLLMSLTLPLTATAQVVDIPDPNLRAAIENKLGKAPGTPIAPAEMVTLTHLEARNANISDLTGLEGATNLKSLRLEGEEVAAGTWNNSNSVSDLSPLAGLTRLEELDLWKNSVSDISPVANLTHLIHLRSWR